MERDPLTLPSEKRRKWSCLSSLWSSFSSCLLATQHVKQDVLRSEVVLFICHVPWWWMKCTCGSLFKKMGMVLLQLCKLQRCLQRLEKTKDETGNWNVFSDTNLSLKIGDKKDGNDAKAYQSSTSCWLVWKLACHFTEHQPLVNLFASKPNR